MTTLDPSPVRTFVHRHHTLTCQTSLDNVLSVGTGGVISSVDANGEAKSKSDPRRVVPRTKVCGHMRALLWTLMVVTVDRAVQSSSAKVLWATNATHLTPS